MTHDRNTYDDARDALNRLHRLDVRSPANVQITWHGVDDETATEVLEALDTYSWTPGNNGGASTWLTGIAPGGLVRVVLHLTTPEPASTEHPNVTRARELVQHVTGARP